MHQRLATAVPPGLSRRHVVAATLGNALEFYDFVTYTFFAIQIGHAFFPSQNAFSSLMLSLATFGAGFVTRPIGGIVIGAYGDRAGRRAAMMLSFTLMGAAIIVMALIPTYAQIGIAAPILAITARMVQGFSLGGEVGPTTAYLMEAVPPHKRGLSVAWQGGSQQVASIVGGLVGLSLSLVLSHSALETYGWRIAFLLGAVTLPFGLILRRTMPETLHEPELHPVATTKGRGALRDNARIITLGVLVLAGGTISTYVTNYMTTFAQGTLHMAAGIAFAASLVPNIMGLAGGLYGGWLSDRIGRRPVMIWFKAIYTVAIIPVFYWIVTTHSPLALLGGMGTIALIGSISVGAFYPALCETLPKPIRGQAFAVIYAVAIAVFGGTTQLVITWLIHVTGNPMAPGWYLMIAQVVALIAMSLMLESAPVRRVPDLTPQPA